MATITAKKITDLGLASSLSTCTAGGDDFTNTGIEFIRIQNTHASQTYTVKVKAQKRACKHPVYGNLTKDHVYVIVPHATNSAYIGPFKSGSFDTPNNKVQISYAVLTSGVTDATFDAAALISTISSGDHKLKIEVLYLEN